MAPSYSELGLVEGDRQNLGETGSDNLNNRFNMCTKPGDLIEILEGVKTGFINDKDHILVRIHSKHSVVDVVVEKKDDLFEGYDK